MVLASFYLLIGASSAHATLLFSGGEDIDFACANGGGCGFDSNTTPAFRTPWARGAYFANGTTSDPPTNRFATPSFAANSTLWVHAQYCTAYLGGCNNSTSANTQLLRAFDTSNNPTLVVRGTGTAAQLQISSRTAAGVFSTLVTCPAAVNAEEQLDLYINYGTSASHALFEWGQGLRLHGRRHQR